MKKYKFFCNRSQGVDGYSFSKPYHPQSKAIERFFDTVDCQFCKTFSTYVGKNTAQKPENLNDYLASQQAVEEAETLATFTKLFDEYAAVYNNTPHSALDGQTPMQVFSQRDSKRVAVDGVLELMCRVWSPELTVGKNGIRFKGLWYGQYDPLVLNQQGKKVRVSCDPDDVSEVFVYDAESWQLITRAECNEIIAYGPGVADAQLRAAMRQKGKALKLTKQARPAQRTAMMTPAALAREARQAETRPTPAENPRSKIKIVRTRLDGQVEKHARAGRKQKLKQAVGGIDLQLDTIGAARPSEGLIDLRLDEVFYELERPRERLTWDGDDD